MVRSIHVPSCCCEENKDEVFLKTQSRNDILRIIEDSGKFSRACRGDVVIDMVNFLNTFKLLSLMQID